MLGGSFFIKVLSSVSSGICKSYLALSLVSLGNLLPEAWCMVLVLLRNAEILKDIQLRKFFESQH